MKSKSVKDNGKSKPFVVPTIKSQLPKDQWLKRVESPIYGKKVRNLTRLLKTLDPLGKPLSGANKKIVHYFLDVMTVDEFRRPERSSTESKAEVNASTLKDSVKY